MGPGAVLRRVADPCMLDRDPESTFTVILIQFWLMTIYRDTDTEIRPFEPKINYKDHKNYKSVFSLLSCSNIFFKFLLSEFNFLPLFYIYILSLIFLSYPFLFLLQYFISFDITIFWLNWRIIFTWISQMDNINNTLI